MAYWRFDPIDGNDNNSGDSWTVDLTKTDGVANGTTTFTSASSDFTGMEGRLMYISSKGVTRGIVTVNSATSVVLDATVTTGSSLSFIIGGPVKTLNELTVAKRRITGGDVVRFLKSDDTTSCGVTSDWTQGSKTVTISSALTSHINTCESAWTAGANATTSAPTTTYKMGTKCSSVVTNNNTPRVIAYAATANTDYSAYQQISFWFFSNAAISDASRIAIDLCSDTNGAVPVNTFAIPAWPATSSKWAAMTIDYGGALGNSIQSVAIRQVGTLAGGQSFVIDNLIACKAPGNDALSLTSLISQNSKSKSDFGDDLFFALQSIDGTTLMIDNDPSTLANAGQGYHGATVTGVNLYKREPILLTPTAATTNTFFLTTLIGSHDAKYTYSGGWNSSSDLQDGETYYSAQIGNGYIFNIPTANSVIEYFGLIRGTNTLYMQNHGVEVNHVKVGHSSGNAIQMMGATNSTKKIDSYNSVWGHITYQHGMFNHKLWLNSFSHTNWGTQFYSGALNSTTTLHTANNSSGGVYIYSAPNYLKDSIIEDTVEFGWSTWCNGYVQSQNHDQGGTDKIFCEGGSITPDTSVRYVAKGYSLRFEPTSTSFRTSVNPIRWVIATIPCEANRVINIYSWMRRSNTGLTLSLAYMGGQIDGEASNVIQAMTAIADTWEQVTIQLEPTADGVIEIEAQAYGGTTYMGYVHGCWWQVV